MFKGQKKPSTLWQTYWALFLNFLSRFGRMAVQVVWNTLSITVTKNRNREVKEKKFGRVLLKTVALSVKLSKLCFVKLFKFPTMITSGWSMAFYKIDECFEVPFFLKVSCKKNG